MPQEKSSNSPSSSPSGSTPPDDKPRRSWLVWAAKRLAVVVAFVVILRLTGCMEFLFYYPTSEPTPISPDFLTGEEVWFESSDGTRLFGWFIPADSNVAKSPQSPTILQVHGNAGNITSHIWFTEYLPAAGFNLFIFDYRGYGQSEGRARTRGPLIRDTEAALEAILARTDIDPNKIGIYGQSLGGSIALNVMADRPEVKCAVIESAFASWRQIAAESLGGAKPGLISRSLAAILISDSHRPDDAIKRIKRPILFVHGTADSLVRVSHSRTMTEDANPWAELMELDGGEHNTLRETHPEVERRVIEFFNRCFTSNSSSAD